MESYKYWRNRTTALICASNSDFFAKYIADNKNNSYLWKLIKNINGSSADNKIPDEIIVDDVSYNEKSEILNKLNGFFSTISDKLKSDRSAGTVDKDYNFNKLKEYMDGKVSADTYFRLTLTKLTKLISALETQDPKRSTGLDGTIPKVLKTSAHVFGPTLLKS